MSSAAFPSCPSTWAQATQQIHSGYEVSASARPVVPPVHLSAAYEFSSLQAAREAFAQREAAFTYARTGSPTVAALEKRVAALEGGIGAVAAASGQSAIALTLLALAWQRKHILISNRIYGGTADLVNDTLAQAGITASWLDPHDPAAWRDAANDEVAAFFVESIGNPHGDLPNIPALADIAHDTGAVLIVDNTLATPYLFRPAAAGADFVVHSATKYFTGNGTALGGVVVDTGHFDPTRQPEHWPQFTAARRRFGGDSLTQRYGSGAVLHLIRAQYLHDLGPCLAPWNAQQILQGLETLDVRVQRQCQIAQTLAHRLSSHPGVVDVHHGSLPQDRNAQYAAQYFPRGTGAVLSFELDGDLATVERFINALRLFKLAANIGDSRSMVAHPASMTHCRLSAELRAAGGVSEQTIRLSVGREDPADLWADLDQAFTAAGLSAQRHEDRIRPDVDFSAQPAVAGGSPR